MKNSSIFNSKNESPPDKGLSLAWRLALYVSVIVTIVMGTISTVQEVIEIRLELKAIETALEESLHPLVTKIPKALSINDIRDEIIEFHDAYTTLGNRDHHFLLKDNREVIISTSSAGIQEKRGYSRVDVTVTNPLFADGQAVLSVIQDNNSFWANVKGRWQNWVIHFCVTLVSILIFLQVAIRHLVTGPLERLLDGIRKTGMGYWGDVEDVGGAWEIRWINWRFHVMGKELQQTVQQLLAAQQRAYNLDKSVKVSEDPVDSDPGIPGTEVPQKHEKTGRTQYLEKICQELETSDDRNFHKSALAREVIEQHAREAEQLGDMDLKNCLENAALQVLEPALYREIVAQLEEFKLTNNKWLAQSISVLKGGLSDQMVPVHSLQYRIKHVAGILRKMQTKKLTLAQVHDLIAVRVVVPAEADCYWALRVIHETFKPVTGRFKDYIAKPKSNGYKSIHTCVSTKDEQIFEIQIRSVVMHQIAEQGEASHFSYKKDDAEPPVTSGNFSTRIKKLFSMLRQWMGR